MKRRRMNKDASRRLFSRSAGVNRVHPVNSFPESKSPVIMRGGIRL